MRGITGFFLERGAADHPAAIRSMCDQIRHRGPDDEGVHIDGGRGIGMRRLSIIGLSTRRQPISNEDRTVWVVCNGEIDNFQQLRQNLISRGHRFAANSDTETLIHLYERESADGLRKSRGIFAYAIWDALAYFVKRAVEVVGGVGIVYYALAFRFCLRLGRVLRRARGPAAQ